MPGPIRIVTDSSAHFIDPAVIRRYRITVVPLEIRLGTQTYREGVDITSEAFMRRLADSPLMPVLLPPTVEQFAEVYANLHRETDRIVSLHLSRAMHATWQNAKAATETLLGRCEIAVVDSQTISVGLGFLVETAAKLAEEVDSIDELVRTIRRMVPQIYSIFSVEKIDYLRRSGLMSESQATLGTMLGIKPFLTIEEGELMAMEKVRTRSQAVDKLVEFVTEFASVEYVVVLNNIYHAAEQLRQLQERIAAEFSDKPFPVLPYSPSMACFLGPEALGIMIFERDLHEDDEDPEDEEY
jgi:DegV family protein with EDD domain